MERVTSRYYEVFTGESGIDTSWFERLILLVPPVARLESGFGLEKDYDETLQAAQLGLTTPQVFSFAIYAMLSLLLLGTVLLSVLGFDTMLAAAIYGAGLFITAGIVAFPILKARRNKMLVIGQSPLAILYMVISLRVNPTLENAVIFAAKNVPDPVGRVMKNIVWQVQNRTFSSVAEAIYDYSSKIKPWAPGFSDSLYLVANSVDQPTISDRERTLEKAVTVNLEYTKDVMSRFARGLSMPVMATNALGVILPVLGLVMAPMMSIFSQGTGIATLLTVSYNIVLPMILFGMMAAILSGRPGSFSIVDLSLYPERKGLGTVEAFGMHLNPSVIGLGIFLFLGGTTLLSIITQGGRYFQSTMASTDSLKTVPLLLGVGLGAGVYLWYGNRKKTKLAKEIKELEREFSPALYQLANIMQQGMPLEQALYEASYALKGTKSALFFRTAIDNIQKFGLPPTQAFFDKEVGAIKIFPSSLIRNILEIVLSSAERSTYATAKATQSISVYLQNIQSVEEKIEDLLSESISTMKFQSYILIPLISGVVVGLSQMITQILMKITEQMNAAFTGSTFAFAGSSMMSSLINIKGTIPPSYLQLVVGTFTLELLFLIGLFSGGLEKSIEDESSVKTEIGQLMSIGIIIYVLVTAVVAVFFSGMMAAVL